MGEVVMGFSAQEADAPANVVRLIEKREWENLQLWWVYSIQAVELWSHGWCERHEKGVVANGALLELRLSNILDTLVVFLRTFIDGSFYGSLNGQRWHLFPMLILAIPPRQL